ncbi:hypothetical protein D3C72_2152830 [compost metagenome]
MGYRDDLSGNSEGIFVTAASANNRTTHCGDSQLYRQPDECGCHRSESSERGTHSPRIRHSG